MEGLQIQVPMRAGGKWAGVKHVWCKNRKTIEKGRECGKLELLALLQGAGLMLSAHHCLWDAKPLLLGLKFFSKKQIPASTF
jgi:hypothetical protein